MNKIPLATPDFDNIKESLKTYLRTQDKFADYDFEGSVMSTLLDVLALNTHYNAFYLNQVGNEAFLSTAINRDSITARAKAIGYVPKSATCARANVYVELTAPTINDAFIIIPSGTVFHASSNNDAFLFRTLQPYRAHNNGSGTFIASSVTIVEGKRFTHKFVIDANLYADGIVLKNQNIDTSIMSVSVDGAEYKKSDDITDNVGPTSQIYYLSEVDGGYYNVYFGDGVLGTKVPIGSNVDIAYMTSSLTQSNGVGSFSLIDSLPGVTSKSIVVIDAAFGAGYRETDASIKLNAPRLYEAQNRAVTKEDYITLLRNNYPNVSDVIAWGGEDNIPKRYGRVYISVKPASGYFLTGEAKVNIKNFLSSINTVTVEPIVVDPDYIFVDVDVHVTYDLIKAKINDAQLKLNVEQAIMEYNNSSIGSFDRALRYSVVSGNVTNSDPSIISNTMTMRIRKKVYPVLGVKGDIALALNNPLKENTLVSSRFTFNNFDGCFMKDNGAGRVDIVRLVGVTETPVARRFGYINYDTGLITLNGFVISAIEQSANLYDPILNKYFITLTATPRGFDVNPTQKQIVQIDGVSVTTDPISNLYR